MLSECTLSMSRAQKKTSMQWICWNMEKEKKDGYAGGGGRPEIPKFNVDFSQEESYPKI